MYFVFQPRELHVVTFVFIEVWKYSQTVWCKCTNVLITLIKCLLGIFYVNKVDSCQMVIFKLQSKCVVGNKNYND